MNKVFNWTIGSFFRTIGRMLAFFIVGIAVAYILAQSDFNISNIFRYALGVHASELTGSYQNVVWWSSPFYIDSNKQTACTSVSSGTQFKCNRTLYSGTNNFVEVFADIQLNNNYDYLMIPFAISTGSHSILGAEWQNVINTIQSLQVLANINGNGGNRTPVYFRVNFNNSLSPTEDNPTNEIALVNGYLYIPTHVANGNNILESLYFSFASTFPGDIPFNLVFSNSAMYVKDTNGSITNAINSQTQVITNQTQQDQEQHEEMMDSNTTQAEDDAEDFFESFDAPDIGGLSAIVTAPLNTIRSLLNSTCTNLVLPLPFVNKNLTLPCMNDIYTEHFGAFFSLYQTIILGIIAYRCIRSIFFDLQGFANPSDDRIEVMDL